MDGEQKEHDGVLSQMLAIQREAMNAVHVAQAAAQAVSSHEVLCAERYDNIKGRLANIPLIFTEIGKVKQIVYIGVGIWIGLPVIAGFMYGLWQMIKGMSHGQ